MRTIAFFDFDGTLITGEHGEIVAVPALLFGGMPLGRVLRYLAARVLHKLGWMSRDAANRVGFAVYRGAPAAALRAAWEGYSASHLAGRISAPMQVRLATHRDRGDRLVLLTLAPSFVVTPLATAWGLEIIATRLQFVNDVCTGEVDGEPMDGEAKLAAARALAAAEGVRLDACTFYSDHPADLPLLERVGAPVVVGGRTDMARVARARGWERVAHR